MGGGLPTVDQHDTDTEAEQFVPPALEDLADLFPQLELLELIGRGGMGAVYKARQPELERLVALKILTPRSAHDPGFAERFMREARALARLNHPHIVAVYDFGHKEDLNYFVMEFVDGANLREVQKAGELSAQQALAIVPQICEALQFAHNEGVVHRDIKPENVLLDQKGRVKIADFGLAKIVGKQAQNLTLTAEGHVMGTPHYMAPEQVEHPHDVDHRADIYSLGVVFYEMLTGELPLGKFAAPSRMVQVDVRLDEVVLKTLEKRPERRYQQVSQVGTEVQTIASSDSAVARANAPTEGIEKEKTPLVRTIELWYDISFTSPLAVKLINMSYLGFLAFLAFLGYAPLPGMRVCFGFSGFAGFFGLIGFAFMAESRKRHKDKQTRQVKSEGEANDSSIQETPAGLVQTVAKTRRRLLVPALGLIVLGVVFVLAIWLMVPRVQRYMRDRGRSQALRFGPVVERTFQDSNFGPGGVVLWDLDSDTAYYPAEPIAMPDYGQLHGYHHRRKLHASQDWQRWVKSTGADLALVGGRTRDEWKLIGLGAMRMVLHPPQHAFEAVTLQHFGKRADRVLWVQGRPQMSTDDRLVGFRTDKHVPGVLEFRAKRELPDVRDIITIRYKLQAPAIQASPPDHAAAPENGLPANQTTDESPQTTLTHLMHDDSADVSSFVKQLSLGSIEILAVSGDPCEAGGWWKPDGSVWQGPEIPVSTPIQLPEDDTVTVRRFLLRGTGLPQDPIWPRWDIPNSFDQIPDNVLGQEVLGDPNMRLISMSFSPDVLEADLGMGVTAGPWVTAALSFKGQLLDTGEVAFTSVQEKDGEIVINVRHHYSDHEVAVFAVSRQGTERRGTGHTVRSDGVVNTVSRFKDLRIADVMQFEFRERPYQWITFKGIALQPTVPTSKDVPLTEQVVDFNDPAFWSAQIVRHLEAVRSLDAEIETERQTFAEDQQLPEKRHRYQFNLKWDRDNKWIDCTSQHMDSKWPPTRVIQGPDLAWGNRGDHDWTKVKAGSRHMAVAQFSYFGEMRKNAYEHAFGVARGIICSHMLHLTQRQGAMDWAQVEFKHRVDDQGRHVLEKTQMTPGLDGEQVEVGMALLGQWEQGAFKLLELRGICSAYEVDLLYEQYSDHVFSQGAWVPRQVIENDWITPQPGSTKADAIIRLREKRITTVKRLVVNRPMQAHEFTEFRPPAGSRVSDTIGDTHYTVWPDLDRIRAQGGKDRVAVKGRVYLDGRPAVGMTVTTLTDKDPNSHVKRSVTDQTDSEGRFVLDGLIPGFRYQIMAEDAAGYTAKSTVRLSDQGEDYLGLKIDMTSGLTVTGCVTNSDQQPIANALVSFRNKPTVKTDAEGRYAISGLYADQKYEVEAGAQGYAPLDPGGDVITRNYEIQLDPNGQPLPFDITLEKERILHGRLVDQDGQPKEGVRVNVWSSPFGLGSTWKWYDTYTDPNGAFQVGNLGDRIYAFFVGQYGNVYHNPAESPVILRVTGDSFMPEAAAGRALVDDKIRMKVETFESAYRQFFRLKEFKEASNKNQGGKLISQWLEQLADPNSAQQRERLARLGSVPAFQAHNTLEQILGGAVSASSRGAVTHFDSNMQSAREVGPCPPHLVACQDPNIICLAMRALARSGFAFEHARLLMNKLDHENALVRAYAQVALAEMTGVYQGPEKPQWQTWLDRYGRCRQAMDTRGHYRLFASVCKLAQQNELSSETIEQVMAAWQGGSAGALRFREILGSEQGTTLWRFLGSIKIDGDKPIQYGHARGYWASDMFRTAGHRNHDLRLQFERPCTLGDRRFEPGQAYVIPALFRDGYQGKWEIVDLRIEDTQPVGGNNGQL